MHNVSYILLLLIVFLQTATSCSTGDTAQQLPEKLVVGTVYSPSGFFIMRGDTLGYDYERIKDFANTKGVQLEFKVAPNLNVLINMLNQGQVDVLATEVPNSDMYRKQVLNCGSINETQPVLVQHSGQELIMDVTQLAGKQIVVEKNSHYEALANNLNSQIGGTIDIKTVPQDSVSTDDLIDMVSTHKIPLTIIDSDIAQFNATYYDSIDVSLTVGIPQYTSWAVSPQNQHLAEAINEWSNSIDGRTYSKAALERYIKKSHIKEGERNLVNEIPHLGSRPSDRWAKLTSSHSRGYTSHTSGYTSSTTSSYNDLFNRYASASGWDAHLLSAVARIESNFNPNAVSWAGARGLMQVMPGTARGYGVSADQLNDPEVNVRLAAQCLRDINKKFLKRIPNRDERLKFILASYNAGAGHVLDAMALAEKYGKNPQVWYGNVEEAILWKANPQYYNDPVCRYGYCRGRETVNYVRSVLRVYGR